MADSTLNFSFEADTSSFEQGVNTVNDGIKNLGFTGDGLGDKFVDLFGSIEAASDKMTTGILRGTQTWQQAIQRAATDALASFVNTYVIGGLFSFIQAQTDMVNFAVDANAEREASDEASAATTLGARAAAASSSILNDAKEVFSGIFAFLAPAMGPAAAVPAAAGSASVASLASSIVYAENGAWNIPGDTFAYLHAGEMVVPQSFASQMRDGSMSGGGDSYTINVQAIDTQTGAQFLKNNASTIAQALSGQARNFNRNVPVWKN